MSVRRTCRVRGNPDQVTEVTVEEALVEVTKSLEEGKKLTGGYHGGDLGIWITHDWRYEVELVLLYDRL